MKFDLNDISNDLIIINKITIEKLFSQKNLNGLILYIFYYKTAKWQKTNQIKANDTYVKKSLHWGSDKLKNAKELLKQMKLIDIIKNRNDKNQIDGWYIKINYYSTTPETTTPIIPDVGKQETNAYNNNNKCLYNNKNTKENIKRKFEKFWEAYPKKKSKGNAEKWFDKNNPSDELVDIMIDKISLLKNTEQWTKDNGQYIPYPTTWLNAKGWEDEIYEETGTVLHTDGEGAFWL